MGNLLPFVIDASTRPTAGCRLMETMVVAAAAAAARPSATLAVRTPALPHRRAMRVERALSEAEQALVVAELVCRDAQLRVLAADIQSRRRHVAHVCGMVRGKVWEGREESLEASRVRGCGVLRVELERLVVGDGEGEGDHGDGPATDAHGGGGLALRVEISDQGGRHVPVQVEIEVLQGVHGQILELVEVEMGGEEVEAYHGPVHVLSSLLARVVSHGDGFVEEAAECARRVKPLNEERKHGGRFVW